MHIERNPILVRTIQELTTLWKAAFPSDYIIGDLRDPRWQSVLWAIRRKKSIVITFNQGMILFSPQESWGERYYSRKELKTVGVKLDLINRLLSYNGNSKNEVLRECQRGFKARLDSPDVTVWLEFPYDFSGLL